MRGWLLAGLLALLPVTAHAQWKIEQVVLAVTSSVGITTDWLFAIDRARRFAGSGTETNIILGSNPSVGTLNTYNLLVIPLNLYIGAKLPSKYRTVWFAGVTGFQLAVIQHQRHLGLRFNFDL